jgi:cell division protein FtsB
MLQTLKAENTKLLEQLNHLRSTSASSNQVESAHAPVSSGVPLESFNSLKAENEKLQRSIEEKEKRLLRLKEVA